MGETFLAPAASYGGNWISIMLNSSFKLYLSGPIAGLSFDDAEDWRQHVIKTIDPRIICYSPLRAKEFLRELETIEPDNVARFDSPFVTDSAITTRDRFDCMGSDLMLVNLMGAERISVGTMIELGWADAARVPVVLAMEKGNAHEHPIVHGVCGFRVHDLDSAIRAAELILLNEVKVNAKRQAGFVTAGLG